MKSYIKYMLYTFIATILVACGGGSSGSNNSNPPIVYNLPNSGGAVLTIPTNTISIASGNSTSTSITLQGGYKDLAIALSSNTTANSSNTSKLNDSSNPIQVSFTPATLIAGTKDIDASISITVTGALNAGTYPINLYASYIPQGSVEPVQVQIGTLNLTVNNITPTPPVVAGSLSISPSPTIEQIGVGYKRYVTVSLVDSQNVSSFNVTLTSSNPAVATINAVEPQVCTLSTESNVCTIAVNGVSLGNASITASAANYTSVQSSVAVVQYAYLVYTNTNYLFSQCTVTENGIISNSCHNIAYDANVNELNAISFNGDYAYITDIYGSYIECHIGVDGIESSTCNSIMPSAPGDLSMPFGMMFSGNYAYIMNDMRHSYYTQCNLKDNGSIDETTCTNSDAIFNYAGNAAANNKFAYISQEFPGFSISYYRCDLSNNGLLDPTSCQAISYKDTGFTNSINIVFNGKFAYFSQNNGYSQCSFSESGLIDNSSCLVVNNNQQLNNLQEFSFAGKYVYFGKYGASPIQCMVSESSGIITDSCSEIMLDNIDLSNNRGIAIH